VSETRFTRIPESDAAPGLSAADRSASPNARALQQEREERADEWDRDEHEELIAADDEVADGPTLVDRRGVGDLHVDLRQLELQEQV